MVKTASTMLPLGSLLPSFDLPLVKGKIQNADFLKGSIDRLNSQMLGSKPALFMILCVHCPFVKHIEGVLTTLQNDFASDIDFIGVASNSLETHPEDGPQYLAEQRVKNYWTFPYLIDSEQTLAKSLRAACTPDFFLFSSRVNGEQKLIYRGQLDDSRPTNNIPLTGSDLRSALESALAFKKVSSLQKPSIGCNIKWTPGFEPDWFY